jgi:8-oxo-dGTP diphosphatase
MTKGMDYIGVTVSFYCHDGDGNYVMTKRSNKCRDEHGCWDFGGGGLRFGETLQDGLVREIKEEYDTDPKKVEFMGFDEVFREHDGKPTHWISFRYRVRIDRSAVKNNEPEKHDELVWVRMNGLPQPLHSQVSATLDKYRRLLI